MAFNNDVDQAAQAVMKAAAHYALNIQLLHASVIHKDVENVAVCQAAFDQLLEAVRLLSLEHEKAADFNAAAHVMEVEEHPNLLNMKLRG